MRKKGTLKNRGLALWLTGVMLFSSLQVSVPASEEAGDPASLPYDYSTGVGMEGIDESSVDETEEENIAVSMPAQSFFGIKGGIFVTILAPEGALPENTQMVLTPIGEEEILDAVEDAVGGEVGKVRAVDITFLDADGNVIEPLIPVEVKLRAYGMGDGRHAGRSHR